MIGILINENCICNNSNQYAYLVTQFNAMIYHYYFQMDQWLSDIAQHCTVSIENYEVSRITEILADINGTNENGDLDSMRQVRH